MRIPEKQYQEIIKSIPISCVDIMITRDDNKFLLGKRVCAPGKNEWFPIGGRVFKGETLKKAATRKLKEEIGITVKPATLEFLTADETIFKGKTVDENRHSVNVVYILHLKHTPTFKIDTSQIIKLEWFSKNNTKWHPYVKKIVKLISKNKNE